MGREKNYFPLSLDQLRTIGSWAADFAERALPVYEVHVSSDSQPRTAIDDIQIYACGGKIAQPCCM